MERPYYAPAIALLVFLRGLLAILIGLVGLGFVAPSFLSSAAAVSAVGLDVGSWTANWTLLRLIMGTMLVLLAFGMYRGVNWAWTWTVPLMVFTVTMDMMPLVTGDDIAWITVVFDEIVLVILVITILRTRHLKQ